MSTETNRNITESNTLSDVNKIDPQDLYISMEGLEDWPSFEKKVWVGLEVNAPDGWSHLLDYKDLSQDWKDYMNLIPIYNSQPWPINKRWIVLRNILYMADYVRKDNNITPIARKDPGKIYNTLILDGPSLDLLNTYNLKDSLNRTISIDMPRLMHDANIWMAQYKRDHPKLFPVNAESAEAVVDPYDSLRPITEEQREMLFPPKPPLLQRIFRKHPDTNKNDIKEEKEKVIKENYTPNTVPDVASTELSVDYSWEEYRREFKDWEKRSWLWTYNNTNGTIERWERKNDRLKKWEIEITGAAYPHGIKINGSFDGEWHLTSGKVTIWLTTLKEFGYHTLEINIDYKTWKKDLTFISELWLSGPYIYKNRSFGYEGFSSRDIEFPSGMEDYLEKVNHVMDDLAPYIR